MKRLLILLRERVENHLEAGMCLEADLLNLPFEEYSLLTEYLTANQPKIMTEFYALEDEYLPSMTSDLASDKACEETGHPHGGYWFERGNIDSRLEWLDKHIKLNS